MWSMRRSKRSNQTKGLPGSPFCFFAAAASGSERGARWLLPLLLALALIACAEPVTDPVTEPSSAEPVASASSPSIPAATPLSTQTPATNPSQPPRSGEAIVAQYCAVCHGRGLYNAPKIGDTAAWQSKLAEGREHLWQVVLHGEKAMPPRGNCPDCSDAELRAAMDYLIGPALPAPQP